MGKNRLKIIWPESEVFEAVLSFKSGALYIRTTDSAVISVEFVSPDFPGASRPNRLMIVDDAPEILIKTCQQLREYFAGQRKSFDLPIRFIGGSEFQRKVWEQLQNIPYGATWSYEELADKIRREDQTAHQMARAVGSACAANPIPVIVPCHRVIGKNGRLVGFAGGVDLKAYLLNHEMLGI